MQIIKRGTIPTPPPEREYQGTCRHCGTLAQAKESELRWKTVRQSADGFTMEMNYAACPLCKTDMRFDRPILQGFPVHVCGGTDTRPGPEAA